MQSNKILTHCLVLEAEAVSEVLEAMAGLLLSRTLLLAPAPLRRTVLDVELLMMKRNNSEMTKYCYFQVTPHITTQFTSEV